MFVLSFKCTEFHQKLSPAAGSREKMSLLGLTLLLLAAKADAQRPSLRQPQGLTTDDRVAASRARTSADSALVKRFQHLHRLALSP